MLKYAQIIDEATKLVSVGLGDNSEFYKSIGMTQQEVERSYNGAWYLTGYAPEKPEEVLAEEKRAERDKILQDSDTRMLPDFPISQKEKELWVAYRTYLRDLPASPDFPNVEVLSFEAWSTPAPVDSENNELGGENIIDGISEVNEDLTSE